MRKILSCVAMLAVLAASGTALAESAAEKQLLSRLKAAEGWQVSIFAEGLGRPRLMQMTENGDIIVSGYRDGNILLVKADADGDGRSDGMEELADGLNNPHGLLLEGDRLLVAEETRIRSYGFDGKSLTTPRTLLDDMPEGSHSSRTLKRGPEGLLYVSLGSNCNSCIEDHPWRAAIIRFKEGQKPEIFASGLRNTVGFAWQPGTGNLYGVDNGRDRLGDDVPDDEVNLIREGLHYGWPYVHGFGVKAPGLHAKMPGDLKTEDPVHGLGAHVAPLAITFLRETPNTALVTEHGSWNRSEKVGYRVVKLDFAGGKIEESVFLSGCLDGESVFCRPVDVIEGKDGSLYVTDDKGGFIFRLSRK